MASRSPLTKLAPVFDKGLLLLQALDEQNWADRLLIKSIDADTSELLIEGDADGEIFELAGAAEPADLALLAKTPGPEVADAFTAFQSALIKADIDTAKFHTAIVAREFDLVRWAARGCDGPRMHYLRSRAATSYFLEPQLSPCLRGLRKLGRELADGERRIIVHPRYGFSVSAHMRLEEAAALAALGMDAEEFSERGTLDSGESAWLRRSGDAALLTANAGLERDEDGLMAVVDLGPARRS